MAKCESCNKEIEETFLGKLKGTAIKEKKDGKNIFHYYCSECQKKHKIKKTHVGMGLHEKQSFSGSQKPFGFCD